MCDMTHSYVWHDSSIVRHWLIHMWDMTHSYMCDMTHSYVWHDSSIGATLTHSYVRHDSFICVRHDSFICVTWLNHRCDIDSFICVTWLIHMCNVTHSYMCHYLFPCVTKKKILFLPGESGAKSSGCAGGTHTPTQLWQFLATTGALFPALWLFSPFFLLQKFKKRCPCWLHLWMSHVTRMDESYHTWNEAYHT